MRNQRSRKKKLMSLIALLIHLLGDDPLRGRAPGWKNGPNFLKQIPKKQFFSL